MFEKICSAVEELKSPQMLLKSRPTSSEISKHFEKHKRGLEDNGFKYRKIMPKLGYYSKGEFNHIFQEKTMDRKATIISEKNMEGKVLNQVEPYKRTCDTHLSLVLHPGFDLNVQAMKKALSHADYRLEEHIKRVSYSIFPKTGGKKVATISAHRINFDFAKHASQLDLRRENHFRNIVLTLLSGNLLPGN